MTRDQSINVNTLYILHNTRSNIENTLKKRGLVLPKPTPIKSENKK